MSLSLREQSIKGVVWSSVDTWGSNLISAAIFIVLARLLNAEAFGVVALAQVVIALMNVLREQGMANALVQRRELDDLHKSTAFVAHLAAGVVLTIVAFFAAPAIATAFNQPELAGVIRWLSIGFIILSLSSVQHALLERSLRFRALAARNLIAAVVGGCVGIAMALSGYGVWSLVGQSLSSAVIGTIVLWSASDWRPQLKFSFRHFRELFAFGGNSMGIGLLAFVNRHADNLLIGAALGPVALGYYSVAYGLMQRLTQVVTSAVSKVSLPMFSRLQDMPDQMRSAFYTATQLTSAIALPMFFGVAAVAPEFVTTLIGAKWAPSIPVLQVLCLVGVLHSVSFFNGPVIMACGKPSWLLAVKLLNTATRVAGFVIAIQFGGIVAVAASFAITGYLLAPIPLWLVRKLIAIDFRDYIARYAAPITAALFMIAAVMLTRRISAGAFQPLPELFLLVGAGAAAYITVIIIAAPHVARSVLDVARTAVASGARRTA